MLPPVVIAVVMAPMIVTSRAYASDWSNNLWFVWEQSLNIKTLGHPSYFLQSGIGAFFARLLFYGGTLYAVTGFAATVFGEHPLAAYVFAYFLAVLSAYGGWLWLSRLLGLTGWRSHIPAILYVTSSYYVTNIYGRGDFGETVATSALPLAMAGAVYLVVARRWSVATVALFAVAVVFFTGSHPLTLVWGCTFLTFLGLALIAAFGRAARAKWRRIIAVAALGTISLGVNAWSLLPTLAYHNRVFHGAETSITQLWYSTPGALFGILRDTANPAWITGDVQAQAPVLAVAWALIAIAVSWRITPVTIRRAAVGLTALLVFLVWLILSPAALGSLPKPWNNIQFPFRLVVYVTLTGCGLVMLALIVLRKASIGARRYADIALVLVTLISVGLATYQTWHTPSFDLKHRTEVFSSAVNPPPSYYSGLDFADDSAPVVTPTITQLEGGTPLTTRPAIELPTSPFNANYTYPIVVGQSGTVATNVATGPYLVSVKGAAPVGRTPSGLMVVRISGSPGEHETLSFSTGSSSVLKIGLIGTYASLAILALVLAGVFVRRRWSRGEHAC